MAVRFSWAAFAPSVPDTPPVNWADAAGAHAWDAPNLSLFSDEPKSTAVAVRRPVPTPPFTARSNWLPPDAPPFIGYPLASSQPSEGGRRHRHAEPAGA